MFSNATVAPEIDVRAGLLSPTLRALHNIDIIEAAKKAHIAFVVFHILGPSIASLDEIIETANYLSDAKYLMVKNFINDTYFFEWDEATYASYFKRVPQAVEIKISKLVEMATEQVEFLRHQLSIALRRAPPRLRLRGSDRALLVWMTRLWPSLLGATQVVQPETILRWHRRGFTAFWRWKSRKRAGRPRIDRGLRDLIRRMSSENPKWGASRIHGELLMLGFEVAQSTVSKYMVQGGPRSQGWKTFLRNHAQAIAAIDLCVVPTLTFE